MEQLYGYSDQEAERVVTAAERFTSGIEIGGNNWFSSDEEIALRARQHSLDAVDIVAGENNRTVERYHAVLFLGGRGDDYL